MLTVGAGPSPLALGVQPSGASLLFVIYSGHPPNAMLGKGKRESVFVHWKVTSQMLCTGPERRHRLSLKGCERALVRFWFSFVVAYFGVFVLCFKPVLYHQRCLPCYNLTLAPAPVWRGG